MVGVGNVVVWGVCVRVARQWRQVWQSSTNGSVAHVWSMEIPAGTVNQAVVSVAMIDMVCVVVVVVGVCSQLGWGVCVGHVCSEYENPWKRQCEVPTSSFLCVLLLWEEKAVCASSDRSQERPTTMRVRLGRDAPSHTCLIPEGE